MTNKLKIAGINNERIKAYRPFDDHTLQSLRNYYRIGLTYSSNALEGNSLTEPENRVVIEDGLTIEGKLFRESGGVNKEIDKKSGGVKQHQESIIEAISQFPGINTPAIAEQSGLSLRSTQRHFMHLAEQVKYFSRVCQRLEGIIKVRIPNLDKSVPYVRDKFQIILTPANNLLNKYIRMISAKK